MSGPGARQSLSDIDEASLLPIARLADRLLREHSLLTPGHRPVAGRVGRGMEFLDHADYVAGDDVRRIDWRASARRNRPQIRRFHDERHADWTICIDHSSSMVVPGAEKWSLAAHLGACLGYVLLHLGNRVGAITFADAVVRSLPFGSGRGQYGHVKIKLEPLPRGTGFQFENGIVGGIIPKEFIPSIEKGIRSILEQGVVAGYPVEGVRAEIYDGKMHPVDSKDIAFQIAGREAFRRAFEKAGPVLLEPISLVKVTVPDEYVGDIIGDLNTKRAIVLGMGQERGKSVIEAKVPQAELQRYAAELRSLTQGRGIYTVEPSHYAAVPSNIAHDIIEAARKEREEEK